jgi:hypothetical protein
MNFSSLNNAQRPISKNYKRFEGTSVALIAWEIKVLLARIAVKKRRSDECERSDPASMVHPSKRKRGLDGLFGGPCAASAW